MRMLVVGAGATGGYFGGRLAGAGRDVTFLVRPGRAASIRRDGLRIVSPHHGDALVHPPVVTADEIAGPYDVVLLTVKAFGLDAALVDCAKAVGPDTAVMPILNGMQHIDTLRERFGAERVIGGVCKVATTLDAEGRVVQLAPFQQLVYGEFDRSASPRIAALHDFMDGAGFSAHLSADIAQDLWDKWVLLAAMGATTCLLRGTVGEIEAVPGGAETAQAILTECAAVASGSGHAPTGGLLAEVTAMLTAPGSRGASSMYRDLQAGNDVEADQILGDMVRRAASLEIATPLISAAFASLCVYRNRRVQG